MRRHLKTGWLLPLVILLFVLDILLLPVCLHFSYAGSSKTPASTLTYTTGKLSWDQATGIRQDGTAEVDFFDRSYDNVSSSNDDNVVAPGTGEVRKIRLHNKASQNVHYQALVYRLQDDPEIPLSYVLEGTGFHTSQNLPTLPDGVTPSDVLQCVEGSLPGGTVQDFDIGWHWKFEQDRDSRDTALGNEGIREATLGFYVVVEDGAQEVPGTRPKTGDETPLAAYGTLLIISMLALLLLFLTREKEKKHENSPEGI